MLFRELKHASQLGPHSTTLSGADSVKRAGCGGESLLDYKRATNPRFRVSCHRLIGEQYVDYFNTN